MTKQPKQIEPKRTKTGAIAKKRGRKKGLPQSGGTPLTDLMFDDKKNVTKLRDLAANCLTYDQIASCMGIPRTTFYAVLDRRPELRDVIAEGKAKTVDAIAKKLIKDAKIGNTTSQIFFLKAQAGWKERNELVVSGNVKHEITLEAIKRIDAMTDEQQTNRLKELQALEATDTNIIDVEVD